MKKKNLDFLVGLRIDKKLDANLPQKIHDELDKNLNFLFLSRFLDKIPKKHKK